MIIYKLLFCLKGCQHSSVWWRDERK